MSSTQVWGQQLSAQNTYEVSKKAKAGSIIDITTDEGANDIAVTYFVKAKEDFWGSLSALNFETYHFDLNFQFKSMEPLVMDLKNARGKYKGFKFKGDEFSVEGVNMVAFSATVTLKKKLTTYKWDWFAGKYNKSVKVLDKVSLKDDNDNKLYKGPQFETDSTLAFIALGGGSTGGTKFHFIKVDKDINIIKRNELEFPYACSINNGKEVLIEEDGVEKWYYVAVVTPLEVKGSPIAPSAMTYTMLLIDIEEMKVVKNIPFTTPNAGFLVEYAGIIDDEIILSGKTSPTTEFAKVSKAYVYDYDAKKSALNVVRFKGNSLSYCKSYTPEELTSKISAVPGVKGKTTTTAFINYKNVYVYKGQLFINGQCYTAASSVSVMGGGQGSSDNVIMLHFAENGDLITTYVYPFEGYLNSYCDMNKAGTHMYWTILDYEAKDGLIYSPLLSVSKIDIAARKAGTVVHFDQKKTIRLNLSTPILYKKQNEYIAFLGSTKPGILWFGRINFE